MTQTVYGVCAEAMGSYFREGMRILDYGCGCGLFAEYLSRQLEDFTYYGVEPSSRHGRKCIDRANGKDPRMIFGYIGTETEDKAIKDSDVALLISVFTHLDIEQTENILAILMPIIKRDGVIVFTMIHGPEYRLGKPGMYGLKTTYSVVYNTKEQVNYLAHKFKVSMDKKGQWSAEGRAGPWLHDIYQMKAS